MGTKNSKAQQQTGLTPGTWGGRRPGSGRKRGLWVEHSSRPDFERRRTPLLIECPLKSSVPSLQNADLSRAFRRASSRARRFGLRIIQFSLRSHCIELVCELRSRRDLESSLKSLNTTMALAVKKEIRKTQDMRHRGRIFLDRFRLTVLDSAARVHRAIGKIFSGHSESRLKNFSSAPMCAAWLPRLSAEFGIAKLSSRAAAPPPADLIEILASPRLKILRLKTFLIAEV
jgi:hypothetical protein